MMARQILGACGSSWHCTDPVPGLGHISHISDFIFILISYFKISKIQYSNEHNHPFKKNVENLAATKPLWQRRVTHIYHIDHDSEHRSMLLSIPLQHTLMDNTPVSLIQQQTSCRVEGLITEPLQRPFNRYSTHHICLIPLRYHGVSTDENAVALQAQKVSLKSWYKRHSRREAERRTRGDWHSRLREEREGFFCQTPGVRFNKKRKKTNHVEILQQVWGGICLRSRLMWNP